MAYKRKVGEVFMITTKMFIDRVFVITLQILVKKSSVDLTMLEQVLGEEIKSYSTKFILIYNLIENFYTKNFYLYISIHSLDFMKKTKPKHIFVFP